jgi:hypothetical protein
MAMAMMVMMDRCVCLSRGRFEQVKKAVVFFDFASA